MEVRVTHLGGPTVLLEVAGWRLLTDPTFDPAGGRYRFGWGTGSEKLTEAAIGVAELGPIDAALVSHDHHEDNLDAAGRALLPAVGTVVTTAPGAKRLARDPGFATGASGGAGEASDKAAEMGDDMSGGDAGASGGNAGTSGEGNEVSGGAGETTADGGGEVAGPDLRGLAAWEKTTLEAPDRPAIEIVATPCRHGPPLSHPIVGEVIGFSLRWEGQAHGALWISGDTVLYGGLREAAERLDVGTALLHLGGVRFPVSGPLRYTMTGAEAVELCQLLQPRTAIPIHYEGWRHFREGREEVERDLAAAPADVRERFRWLPIGTPTAVDV